MDMRPSWSVSWPQPGRSRSCEVLSDHEGTRQEMEVYRKYPYTRHTYPAKKNRRYRIVFTTDQVNQLEKCFKESHYIGPSQRKKISEELNLPDKCVKVWFQNRRMKQKNLREHDKDESLYTHRNTSLTGAYIQQIKPTSIHDSDVFISQAPIYPTLQESSIIKPVISIEVINKPKSDQNLPNFEIKYYKDEMPSTAKETPFMSNTSNLQTKNLSPQSDSEINYRASAEFSIDLCKKYKHLLSAFKKRENEDSIIAVHHMAGGSCNEAYESVPHSQSIPTISAATDDVPRHTTVHDTKIPSVSVPIVKACAKPNIFSKFKKIFNLNTDNCMSHITNREVNSDMHNKDMPILQSNTAASVPYRLEHLNIQSVNTSLEHIHLTQSSTMPTNNKQAIQSNINATRPGGSRMIFQRTPSHSYSNPSSLETDQDVPQDLSIKKPKPDYFE